MNHSNNQNMHQKESNPFNSHVIRYKDSHIGRSYSAVDITTLHEKSPAHIFRIEIYDKHPYVFGVDEPFNLLGYRKKETTDDLYVHEQERYLLFRRFDLAFQYTTYAQSVKR